MMIMMMMKKKTGSLSASAAALLCLLLLSFSSSSSPHFAHAAQSSVSSSSPHSQDTLLLERFLQDNNNDNNNNYSFLSSYALKFQGCHHVQQWNNNNNDNDGEDNENTVRIATKRLARFRLCLADTCNPNKSTGCSSNSNYGDYIVDLNVFVNAFVTMMQTEQETQCAATATDCQDVCGDNENQDNEEEEDCMTECYETYGMSTCLQQEQQQGFDLADYAYCTPFQARRRRSRHLEQTDDAAAAAEQAEGDTQSYYIGPYCGDQGGEIRLGMFTDDTCTTFAQYGDQAFYQTMGYQLPYSDTSFVSNRCVSCQSYNENNNAVSEGCSDMYAVAGKCETRMQGVIDYPNESSCSYIQGIKIVRADGVIRTSSIRKSKTAAVAIGLFLTTAVLLAGYVYYLRTKLARAQINLAAAAQPLT